MSLINKYWRSILSGRAADTGNNQQMSQLIWHCLPWGRSYYPALNWASVWGRIRQICTSISFIVRSYTLSLPMLMSLKSPQIDRNRDTDAPPPFSHIPHTYTYYHIHISRHKDLGSGKRNLSCLPSLVLTEPNWIQTSNLLVHVFRPLTKVEARTWDKYPFF